MGIGMGCLFMVLDVLVEKSHHAWVSSFSSCVI